MPRVQDHPFYFSNVCPVSFVNKVLFLIFHSWAFLGSHVSCLALEIAKLFRFTELFYSCHRLEIYFCVTILNLPHQFLACFYV